MYFSLNEIRNLTEERINSLKENQIAEGKHLEYKLTLPSGKYDDKKEFLADVSSFANSDGGTIIYGIREDKGIPSEITGMQIENSDAEILRLDNILRTSMEPRIIGVYLHPLMLSNSRYLIIVYIPRSFNPPHVVNFQGHWRFYSRNSAGKYPLEVSELRSLMTLSSTVRERIRNFRIERISRIKNRELPIPITDGPKFIYHLIPLSSFAADTVIDLAKFEHSNIRLDLFYDLIKIYNYEGILIHNQTKEHPANWYLQIFRNGCLEIFVGYLHHPEGHSLDRNGFEEEMINSVNNYYSVIDFFGLSAPLILFHSIFDIKGYKIKLYEFERMREMTNRSFIQNDLILPDILLSEESFSNLPFILKPLFDPIWNAAGHSQSPNFNAKGEWKIK